MSQNQSGSGCDETRIEVEDGSSFQLRLREPDSINPNTPLILCLPAMGVAARHYETLAQAISHAQMVAAIFELRGIASSSERASRNNRFGYHEILHYDLPKAIEFLRNRYPHNPLYLLGHSLGGQLGVLYLSIEPEAIAGFIGVATGSPYYKGWAFPHNLGICIMAVWMRLCAWMIGHFPGRRLGFAGRESRQLIKDWSYSVRTGNYRTQHDKGLFEARLSQLELPALFLTIEQDWLAPPKSSQNLAAKLSKAPVSHCHLTAADFCRDSLGHFLWMKEPDPIVSRVKQWLAEKP